MDHSQYVGNLTSEETKELLQEMLGVVRPEDLASAIGSGWTDEDTDELIDYLQQLRSQS